MIRSSMVMIALAATASAQDLSTSPEMSFQAQRTTRGGDADYQTGQSALDSEQWTKAITAFEASAARRGTNRDGALYWKGYAQFRLGSRDQSLGTLAALRREYPSSRWIKDAQALEVEIHSQAGQPVNPSSESDVGLKMLALNSLMQSDPDQALPILEKILKGNQSSELKDRALFVLTQNSSAQAQKLMSAIARGSSGPDLQMRAIRYTGMMGSEESRKELASIYSSSSDKNVKREILKAFMLSGSRIFLLNAARTERDPELQRDAIQQLGLTGGQDELWQLYGSASSNGEKQDILKSMFIGGNSERLVEVARNEKDASLRVAAIKSLGLMGGNGRGDVLVSIYQHDQSRAVQDAVLNSLFLQQNGKALVDLARAEKNSEMKREIVQKMALVQSKETTDYMMEILK